MLHPLINQQKRCPEAFFRSRIWIWF